MTVAVAARFQWHHTNYATFSAHQSCEPATIDRVSLSLHVNFRKNTNNNNNEFVYALL